MESNEDQKFEAPGGGREGSEEESRMNPVPDWEPVTGAGTAPSGGFGRARRPAWARGCRGNAATLPWGECRVVGGSNAQFVVSGGFLGNPKPCVSSPPPPPRANAQLTRVTQQERHMRSDRPAAPPWQPKTVFRMRLLMFWSFWKEMKGRERKEGVDGTNRAKQTTLGRTEGADVCEVAMTYSWRPCG